MNNIILILMVILAAAMIIVGGMTGFRAFLSLIINFIILFLNVTLMAWGFPILPVTMISSLLILATTIFFGSDDDLITQNAFYSSILVLILLIILIELLKNQLLTPGFSNENSDDLEGMSLLIGINYPDILVSTTVISTLGAIAEASIAVATGIAELIDRTPDLNPKRIYFHGFEIGQEIVGTALNTIFFGFFGSFLGLFIWYVRLNYSFSEFFNNKIFAAEMTSVLIGFIGVILTVPLTAFVMQLRYKKKAN